MHVAMRRWAVMVVVKESHKTHFVGEAEGGGQRRAKEAENKSKMTNVLKKGDS